MRVKCLDLDQYCNNYLRTSGIDYWLEYLEQVQESVQAKHSEMWQIITSEENHGPANPSVLWIDDIPQEKDSKEMS